MDLTPRFTTTELEAIKADAQNALLRDSDSRWVPLVIDLSRALVAEMNMRIQGPIVFTSTDASSFLRG